MISEKYASYEGFEVAQGSALDTALASADMSTIGAGRHAASHVETQDALHSAPLATENLRDSGLVLA